MGRQKKTKHNDARRVLKASKLSIFGLGSLLGTSLLLIMLACPVTPPKVDAAEGEGVTMTSNLSTKTTAYLYSMISLSLSDSIDIDLTPNSTGSLGISSAKVKVSTNNTTGYSLYLATVDQTNELKQVDESLAYSNATSDTSYSIKPLTTNTTASNYLTNAANLNTWGYALTDPSGSTAETVYTGLKNPTSTNIHSVSATSSNDEYKLNIAVAADASLPAGAYQNGLIVSAVANPIALSGFNQIYYMQEMTPEICASAKEHEEGQLVDKRDNTIYWVAKLKDGNCWMTQNLDLDLSPDVALTPEDSNVTEVWRPEVGTNEVTITGIETIEPNPLASWDFGKFVIATPTVSALCSAYGGQLSAVSGDDLGEKCSNTGVNVATGWLPNFESKAGTFNGKEYDYVTVDQDSHTYDAHYLIGNYYRNAAVLAGATPETYGIDVPTSICPKGWKLPTSDRNQTTHYPLDRADSFFQLYSYYGFPSDPNSYTIQPNRAPVVDIKDNALSENLIKSPIYMTRAGVVFSNRNYLSNVGMTAIYRSSTSYSDSTYRQTFSAYLDFNVMSPANADSNLTATTVRCLAE